MKFSSYFRSNTLPSCKGPQEYQSEMKQFHSEEKYSRRFFEQSSESKQSQTPVTLDPKKGAKAASSFIYGAKKILRSSIPVNFSLEHIPIYEGMPDLKSKY